MTSGRCYLGAMGVRRVAGCLGVAMAMLGPLLASSADAAVSLPAGFDRTTILGNLSRPAAVAWTPDGRMLMAMRDGPLRVSNPNGTVVGPYSVSANTFADHGFLGIAVDADYATNNYVYLLYTYENNAKDYAGNNKVSVLERIRLSPQNVASDPKVILGQKRDDGACPAPANTNDCIPSETDSHSIGTVRADPDGTLWVGSGDAADGDGVQPGAFRTYDPTSYAGKILHVDRNGQGLRGHSFCPSDNDLSHVCTKVYAKGFRNPFRFTLRPGGLVVGDVGWNSYEELDLVTQGKDYGWPCWEGPVKTASYKDDPRCNDPVTGEYQKPVEPPVVSVPHTGTGEAIVAGPTYTGTLYPAGYRNTIFYGVYGAGLLWRFDPAAATASDFGSGNYGWVDLEPAPDNGDLVYVDFGNSQDGTGSIGRISYTAGNRTPVAVAGATTPAAGPLPLTVGFRGDQSSDPDGDALTYDWDFGDGSAHSTAANPSHAYTARGRYTATLTVDDQRGRTAMASVTVNAGAPDVTIATPADGSLYTDGVAEALQGSAVDAAGQAIPSSALSWQVILHHNTHTHPGGTFPGATTSFTPFDHHDADSYYDVTLTATDASGVTGSKTVTVRPTTAQVTVTSDPPGAPVSYGGVEHTAPFTAAAAVGYRTSISAADQFSASGVTYTFSAWGDAPARLRDITIPAGGATYTASYSSPPGPSPSIPAPAPVAGFPPPRPTDRTGPAVSVALRRADLLRGHLGGTASDPSSIKGVQVAVRAQTKIRGRCRWWSTRSRRLIASSCARPRWLTASLSPVRADHRTRPWRVSLGRRLPRGRYVVVVHAVDGAGNATNRIGKASEVVVKL